MDFSKILIIVIHRSYLAARWSGVSSLLFFKLGSVPFLRSNSTLYKKKNIYIHIYIGEKQKKYRLNSRNLSMKNIGVIITFGNFTFGEIRKKKR